MRCMEQPTLREYLAAWMEGAGYSSLSHLARDLGCTGPALSQALKTGHLSRNMSLQLEKLSGGELDARILSGLGPPRG